MELAVRGRRDVNPLVIKIGVALALSYAGFIIVQRRFRARPRLPYPCASRRCSSSGAKSQAILKSRVGLKEALLILKNEEALVKIVNGTSTTTTTTTTRRTTLVGLSPTSSSGDKEGFLLPELNDLVMKELEAIGKETEITRATPRPKKLKIKVDSGKEQEIARLRNLVWSLQEKERSLELQLLEYYGMQEQEAAVRELESRLKINSIEAKLYSLKFESLQADNQRLEAQLADVLGAMDELGAARAAIKLLKKKLKSDGEQVKEKIAFLHQKISALQRREPKEEKDNEEVERKFKRLQELEDETAELRMVNLRLVEEQSNLVKKLESAQASASSAVEDSEADALEDVNCLRETNENLMKDIEQIKTDRCTDVEELVYLRWINACLRYELRNYHPSPGRTFARDLSKSLSPRSEEKAKQLILGYANSGNDEKSVCFTDFESEYSSSSPASTGEPEYISVDVPSSRKHGSPKKMKFLSKLKKLVMRKDSRRNKASAVDRTSTCGDSAERRVSFSTYSIDDMVGRDSYGSFSSSTTEELNPANRLGRIDAQEDERCQNQNARSQIYSSPSLDVGTPYRYERVVSGEGTLHDEEGGESPEKVEINKYAAALKRTTEMSKLNKRSESFSD